MLLEQARNPDTAKGYEGERFRYCPWCGERLYLDPSSTVTVSPVEVER